MIEDANKLLENAIAYYVQQGYRVVSQTATTAQLVKPKKFSIWLAIVLLLIYVLPFIIYLFYYLSQKDKTAYIAIVDGKISATDEKGTVRVVENVQQLGPVVFVRATNDPGYSKSTIVVVSVLAALTLIGVVATIYFAK